MDKSQFYLLLSTNMSKKTKFIGDKEIKSIEGTLVTFTDDTQKNYTEKQLSYMVTEESKDLSEQQELLIKTIVPDILNAIQKGNLEDEGSVIIDILNTLQAHDIRFGDFDKVLGTVAMKLDGILKGV